MSSLTAIGLQGGKYTPEKTEVVSESNPAPNLQPLFNEAVYVSRPEIRDLHKTYKPVEIKTGFKQELPKQFKIIGKSLESLQKKITTIINGPNEDKDKAIESIGKLFETLNKNLTKLSNKYPTKNNKNQYVLPTSMVALATSILMNLPGDLIGEFAANHLFNKQGTDEQECVVVIPDSEYQKRMLHNTKEQEPSLPSSAMASTDHTPSK